ncbi:MAG: hypothetical protein FWB96_09950 [Defluviitaleaceae bacterium]|nr:hypothetical protein [Defluviitaleaceae bacterium]MCL2263193.1 hypothetical protein [Defluviitaleaceae bacterium]
MKNDLKNRYIYAVTRHLPAKMQNDVEKELDSLISEMASERGNENSEQTLKDVLTELGEPEELALKYSGSERKSLISGVYYLMYKRVLWMVLPIVAAVITILTIVGLAFTDVAQADPFVITAIQAVAGIAGTIVQAFALITVIFAVLDYKKVDLKEDDFFNLPDIPEEKQKITPLGPITAIIVSISLAALWLAFPQIMGGRFDGEWITVFDTAVLRGLWVPILAWTILEIATEIVKMVEGVYTMRLAIIATIGGVLQAVCAVIVFGNNGIINQGFLSALGEYAATLEMLGGTIRVGNINLVIMAVMLIIIFFETLDVVVTAVKASRR